MPEASIVAEIREKKGKQAAKQLRRDGFIPGILYGPGEDPSMLKIDLKELLTLLHTFGRNAIVDLRIANKKNEIKAFIFDIQHDPISGDITHVDLKHINLNKKIHLSVPIRLTGIPEGVKNEGGILEHVLHALEIVCLPADIPVSITFDVTDLHMGDSIHVSDVEAGNYEILSDISSTVVHVIAPKVIKAVEEEEEVEIEEMVEEGEEPTEPEVIGEEE